MLKAYKYRLYPNKEQSIMFNKHFGCARWIYNWALTKKIEVYAKQNKSLSRFELQKELPILKKLPETQWLSEVSSQSLQYSLEHLDRAYTKFFKEKIGFPKFKSKHKNKESYSLPHRRKIKLHNNTKNRES